MVSDKANAKENEKESNQGSKAVRKEVANFSESHTKLVNILAQMNISKKQLLMAQYPLLQSLTKSMENIDRILYSSLANVSVMMDSVFSQAMQKDLQEMAKLMREINEPYIQIARQMDVLRTKDMIRVSSLPSMEYVRDNTAIKIRALENYIEKLERDVKRLKIENEELNRELIEIKNKTKKDYVI